MALDMDPGRKPYWKLFASTFRLSAFTFGGGYVIVPLMRRRFVEELGWIEDKEMLDLVSISQSAPGAIAVNASILVGYRMAGVAGALVTVLGTVLPPLVILSAISLFYARFRDDVLVGWVLRGLQAGVVALIADVVLTLADGIRKLRRVLPVVLAVLAFLAAYVLRANVMLVILACGAIGALTALTRRGKRDGEAAR